jgi:hypothetical protein
MTYTIGLGAEWEDHLPGSVPKDPIIKTPEDLRRLDARLLAAKEDYLKKCQEVKARSAIESRFDYLD